MGKRKRGSAEAERKGDSALVQVNGSNLPHTTTPIGISDSEIPVTLQIVTGSYEKVLHGLTAEISASSSEKPTTETENAVKFADTFLFNAHSSAIRCLAISPPSATSESGEPPKVVLASGSTDERINLYQLSTTPPPARHQKGTASLPSLAGSIVTENPKNKELGSLLHHASSISALYFPTRSKLLSSSEDNTIAIARTRDWTVLSTIKAPTPKVHGRPSGDTAPPGGSPAGVNDFAVHPSMKLMISVGRGERCMRLWNLVTGKKAGVLSFTREMLHGVGEGKWGSGEGRKVAWNRQGNEFVVGFERGAVTFGMNSKPRSRLLPAPLTKLHQLCYVDPGPNEGEQGEGGPSRDVVAVSTEDGRVIFYSTSNDSSSKGDGESAAIHDCTEIGQLGGKAVSVSGRIKDFKILRPSASEPSSGGALYVVTASSDGAIRVWSVDSKDVFGTSPVSNGDTKPSKHLKSSQDQDASEPQAPQPRQIGKLLGTYETGNRITCLAAFTMTGGSVAEPATEAGSEDDESDDSE